MIIKDTYPKKNSGFDYRLDFIRFISFLLVFICHFVFNGGSGIQNSPNVWWNKEVIQRFSFFGREGVTLFFVLSGFLLGRLMLKEFLITTRISVKKFFLRRILRIWPLYFFFLFICFFINIWTENTGFTNQELVYLLTFTYNFGLILQNAGSSISSITWSLSIEEQIYLLLPLVSILRFRKRFVIEAFIFFLIGTTSLIICDLGNFDSTYFTLSYFLPASLGLFIAVYEDTIRERLINYKTVTFISLGFLWLYPFFYSDIKKLGVSTIIFYLTSFYFFCLLHITDKYLPSNQLVYALAKIGRVSYGCYLYHFIILFVFIHFEVLFNSEDGFSLVGVLLGFISTVIISFISYFNFELYFLKKKQKYTGI
jgi:peptidoglycan/LPS O-acetylase OafA/YrhL